MTRKSIKIEYEEYNSIEELSVSDKELLLQAMLAADKAYSPYSGFKVGASVKLSNGKIVPGNNQENIAYPSGLCAERVALFSAMANNPHTTVEAIAVIGKNSSNQWCAALPCGACRQTLCEYETLGKQKIRIILYSGNNKIIILEGINTLLPLSFEF